MNVEFVLRFVFGVFAGLSVYRLLSGFVDLSSGTAVEFAAVYFACSIGFSLGYVIAPQLTTRPFFGVRSRIYDATASEVLSVGIGLGFGLLVGALLALPLSFLPSYAGQFLPVIGSLVIAYFGIVTMLAHKNEMLGTLRLSGLVADKLPQTESRTLLLDSSAVIDGRIADIARTGFIGGTLVVPRFVLEEIQHIADSPDVLRRNRGRRGLEVLNTLQKEPSCRVEISDVDVENAVGVDAKLVRLARNLSCSIVTTDYNLNHVAQIQGIEVLNVNELTNAVKSVVLQGEDMAVQIVQEGKEVGQGVGYLDDGTMIVVENGRGFLHKGVEVTVTKVLQTAAGRMIFARLKTASNGRGHDVVGQ